LARSRLQHADLDQLAFQFGQAKSTIKGKTLAQFIRYCWASGENLDDQ
jgi:hypothetical protein